jgi:hypothetical protein
VTTFLSPSCAAGPETRPEPGPHALTEPPTGAPGVGVGWPASSQAICRPLSFSSLKGAARAAERIRRATRDGRRPYLAYRCGACALWHLRRRAPFDFADPDDHRRAELVDAGWRQINNPRTEMWRAPECSSRKRNHKKTLDEAWRTHRRRTAPLSHAGSRPAHLPSVKPNGNQRRRPDLADRHDSRRTR